jgi:hypothetical protein
VSKVHGSISVERRHYVEDDGSWDKSKKKKKSTLILQWKTRHVLRHYVAGDDS